MRVGRKDGMALLGFRTIPRMPLCGPLFGNRHCRVCKEQISIDHDFIKHLNDYHPELLCHLSVDDIISGVCSTDSSLIIFSLGLQLCRINSNIH